MSCSMIYCKTPVKVTLKSHPKYKTKLRILIREKETLNNSNMLSFFFLTCVFLYEQTTRVWEVILTTTASVS